MNPDQTEVLRTALEMVESGEEQSVLKGIGLIEKSHLENGARAIISCLESDSVKVRMAAARTLGTLKPDKTVEILTALLRKEKNPFVKATTATALGNTGKMKALTALAGLLRDTDARVRANAVEAVTELGDPLVVNMLTPLLDDKNSRVKTNVAMALWKFGGLRMVGFLEGMLSASHDKYDRASAAYALGEIGGFQAMSSLVSSLYDQSPEVKRNVIRSLGKLGDKDTSSRLLRYLKDSDPNIRANTLEAVGLLNGERYLDQIMELLALETNEAVLQKTAVIFDHLVATGSQDTISRLKQLLFSGYEHVKLTLLEAFYKYGAKWNKVFKVEVLMDLDNVLNTDNSKLVRTAVKKAIKKIKR